MNGMKFLLIPKFILSGRMLRNDPEYLDLIIQTMTMNKVPTFIFHMTMLRIVMRCLKSSEKDHSVKSSKPTITKRMNMSH